MNKMVIIERYIMKGVTFKNKFVTTISISERINRGKRYIKNLIHKKVLMEMGAERTIQKELPSILIDGKAKRAAIDIRTNAARATFRNESRF